MMEVTHAEKYKREKRQIDISFVDLSLAPSFVYFVAISVFVNPAPSIVAFPAKHYQGVFWPENVDEGAGVWGRLGRKCVPFAKVFGKTKVRSIFLKILGKNCLI